MKRYNEEAIANFRSRWSKKEGKVKLPDVLDDLMRDKDLKEEEKKHCLQFIASLIDIELQANEVDTMLRMLTNIKKINKEGWEKNATSREKENDRLTSTDLKLLKAFLGESVDAYKFRDTDDLEKRRKLEILSGELLRILSTKSQGKFLEVGKTDVIVNLIKKADTLINGDKSALTEFTDAINARSKEYKTLPAGQIRELLTEINQRITRQRSVTPTDENVHKG